MGDKERNIYAERVRGPENRIGGLLDVEQLSGQSRRPQTRLKALWRSTRRMSLLPNPNALSSKMRGSKVAICKANLEFIHDGHDFIF